jgi:hypothetical protein
MMEYLKYDFSCSDHRQTTLLVRLLTLACHQTLDNSSDGSGIF